MKTKKVKRGKPISSVMIRDKALYEKMLNHKRTTGVSIEFLVRTLLEKFFYVK
jgi:hypothetical protein